MVHLNYPFYTYYKNLLLKDLCSRLPYGVKARVYNHWSDDIQDETITIENLHQLIKTFSIEDIKPYLFPLSSMTEEQKRELLELTGYEARCEESCGFDSWGFYVNIVGEYNYEDNQESIILYPDDIGIDWLDKNHFDYRGLIPKELALDATGLSIYQ